VKAKVSCEVFFHLCLWSLHCTVNITDNITIPALSRRRPDSLGLHTV
jgi:hypothetical protein